MKPQHLIVSIVVLACLNGLLSPILPAVYVFAPVWLPELFPKDPLVIFYSSSVIVTISTLLLGGVPAAIVEGLTRSETSTPTSLTVWLVGVALLTAPGFMRFFTPH
ncbi:MAG: hypothetical protein SF002_15735 [Alphaproteobacteria bacterium]|nr:hypothetical protein [Alphaproteobacteria bacterium]